MMPIDSRLELISTFRPRASPFPLIRIGGNSDGAYLLPDDFEGIKACFSPGVNNRKNFEDDLLDRFGIVSHMCDFSSDIERFSTPLRDGQTFRKVWLDVAGTPDSITLADWINDIEPNDHDDLLLQMDIEGAEYRNIASTPRNVLKRFRIMTFELHHLSAVNDSVRFDELLAPFLSALAVDFVCVHAHPNNCCGEFQVEGSRMNMPNVLEITFLRRDRWACDHNQIRYEPLLPHPLDIFVNVEKKPPIFLNEYWLSCDARKDDLTTELLRAQVEYMKLGITRSHSLLQDRISRLTQQLYSLAAYTSEQLQRTYLQPDVNQLFDLALGKPYRLSTKHPATPPTYIVIERQPFFFHTADGAMQSITIDLQSAYEIFEIRVRNRSDICLHRAGCLVYSLHLEPTYDLSCVLPLVTGEDFQKDPKVTSVTAVAGTKARYVTILSLLDGPLHLSAVEVFGYINSH